MTVSLTPWAKGATYAVHKGGTLRYGANLSTGASLRLFLL